MRTGGAVVPEGLFRLFYYLYPDRRTAETGRRRRGNRDLRHLSIPAGKPCRADSFARCLFWNRPVPGEQPVQNCGHRGKIPHSLFADHASPYCRSSSHSPDRCSRKAQGNRHFYLCVSAGLPDGRRGGRHCAGFYFYRFGKSKGIYREGGTQKHCPFVRSCGGALPVSGLRGTPLSRSHGIGEVCG